MNDPRAFAERDTSQRSRSDHPGAARGRPGPDGEAVRQLDRESIYFRLFSHRTELTEAGLDRIMRFDPETEVALVVTTGAGADETVIGGGRYIVGARRKARRTAEVAFMVEEDYHGLGIAGRVLGHLADDRPRRRVSRRSRRRCSPRNAAMLAVFARSGLPMRKRRDGGVVHVELSL